ncbi:MAG: PD40 domain-containing protein [Planctomycetota bacterium]|nr:MAG: PD40 domain-containing protein [Planctomycetota bacterium]
MDRNMLAEILILAVGLLAFLAGNTMSQKNDFPVLRGPYLGQRLPGTTPEIFAPGVISTPAHEFSCCFSPDGKEFYFTRNVTELNEKVIMVTRLRDGVWTEPVVVPFVENQFSFEPLITPDNKRLYFMSGKPIPGQAGPPMNVLFVEREADGWSTPKNPGAPFNPAKAMFISSTLDGIIYTTDISEGPGKEAIAVSKPVDGKYTELKRLGEPINAETQSMYPYIAPDESYIVYISRKPSAKIDNVLTISYKKPDGSWHEPKAVDIGMNAGLPFVSPDGKFLFFTGGAQGKSDIYWVSATFIEDLRPKESE